jgi:hypothetical protein
MPKAPWLFSKERHELCRSRQPTDITWRLIVQNNCRAARAVSRRRLVCAFGPVAHRVRQPEQVFDEAKKAPPITAAVSNNRPCRMSFGTKHTITNPDGKVSCLLTLAAVAERSDDDG